MNQVLKPVICFSLAILLFNQKTWSQNSLNIGANLSAGTKSFPVKGKGGLGASLEYLRKTSKTGNLRLYLGYDWFQRRFPGINWQALQDSISHMGSNGYDMSLIPVRIGYQHFFTQNTAFVYAEAGFSHNISRYKQPSISTNCFSYAIGTGYRFELKEIKYLQASVYYNHNRLHEYLKRNYISLRLAYGWSNL